MAVGFTELAASPVEENDFHSLQNRLAVLSRSKSISVTEHNYVFSDGLLI